MSVIYSDHSTMNSPLNNSPFTHDQYGNLNYSTDFTSSLQITNFEKNLMFKFLINHSFNLLISSYGSNFQSLNLNNLNQFILTLFKRINLSLGDFQKLLVILIRFFNKNEGVQIQLSIKQIIIGSLVKILGINSKNWCLITGLSFESLVLLTNHINLTHDEMDIDQGELDTLNLQMKNLVYSKFDVI